MKDEINLLPKPVQLLRIRSAYVKGIGRFFRRIYVLLALLVITELVIWWAVVSLTGQVKVQQMDETGQEITKQVIQTNAFLDGFENRLDMQTSWTLLIESVLAVVPDTIRLKSIKVREDNNALVLEGSSSSRSSVVTFQKNLEMLSWVDRVEAPLQNFALGAQTTFSFSLERNNESP